MASRRLPWLFVQISAVRISERIDRVQRNGCIIVGERGLVVALSAIGEAAIVARARAIGVEPDCLGEIANGGVRVAVHQKGVAASDQVGAFARSKVDGLVVILDRTLHLSLRKACLSSPGIGTVIRAVQSKGLREIRYRRSQRSGLHPNFPEIGIGDALVDRSVSRRQDDGGTALQAQSPACGCVQSCSASATAGEARAVRPTINNASRRPLELNLHRRHSDERVWNAKLKTFIRAPIAGTRAASPARRALDNEAQWRLQQRKSLHIAPPAQSSHGRRDRHRRGPVHGILRSGAVRLPILKG